MIDRDGELLARRRSPTGCGPVINRPLTDRRPLCGLDGDSRAELQIGGAAIRLGPRTSVDICCNLDDRITQLRAHAGHV